MSLSRDRSWSSARKISRTRWDTTLEDVGEREDDDDDDDDKDAEDGSLIWSYK
jgi:hypothetical protein